jgi:hypothetical protein
LVFASFIASIGSALSIILFNLKDILGGVVLLSMVFIFTDILSHFLRDSNSSIFSICFMCKIQRAESSALILTNARFLSTLLTIQS